MEKLPAYKKCYNKLKSDIDNIANGRKDEAMTEYAPNLGHAVCFPVRKGIAAVNKDIM